MKTELSVDNTECMLYSQDNSIQYNNSANMINKFLMMEVEDTFQITKPYPHRDITKKQLGFLIWEKKSTRISPTQKVKRRFSRCHNLDTRSLSPLTTYLLSSLLLMNVLDAGQ